MDAVLAAMRQCGGKLAIKSARNVADLLGASLFGFRARGEPLAFKDIARDGACRARIKLGDFKYLLNLLFGTADRVTKMGELVLTVDLLLPDARDVLRIEALRGRTDTRPKTDNRNGGQQKNGGGDETAHGSIIQGLGRTMNPMAALQIVIALHFNEA